MPSYKGSKELGSNYGSANLNRLNRYRSSGNTSGARTTDRSKAATRTMGNDSSNDGPMNNKYAYDVESYYRETRHKKEYKAN